MQSVLKHMVRYNFLLLVMVFSHVKSQKFNSKTFDTELIHKNETLRLAGNYTDLVALNKRYLKEAEKNNYQEGEALCYINIANICGTIGRYKDEFYFLNIAEKKIKNSNNTCLKSKLYQEYGQVNFGIGLYKNALLYNSKSIYYLRKTNRKERIEYRLERSFVNRADFLYKIDRPDSSLIYFHKALKEKEAPITRALIAKHHMFYTKHLDSSYIYLQQAEKQLPTSDKTITVQRAVVYSVYGDYYDQKTDYQKAIYYYQEALKIYKNTNRIYNIPGIYESLANTYKKLNDRVHEIQNREMYAKAKKALDNNLNEAVNFSIEQIISNKDEETEGYKSRLILYTAELIIFIIILTIGIVMYISYIKKRKFSRKQKQLQIETDALHTKLKNDYSKELIDLCRKNDPAFLIRFKDIHPDFIAKLLRINPSLTNSELSFCAMIALNLNSKEIASYTNVEHKSVQQKKYRIRKKLDIPGHQDLFMFFRDLLE